MDNILVTRSSMPPFEEYVSEIKELWESHWLTNMGAKHEELSKKLEELLEAKHVVLFTNGHMALELGIAALCLPKGGEVITTPFTFSSTTHAIVRNGLIPVFCDIKEDDYTIDENKIEALITKKTVAILPVHVYGNICNAKAIEKIANKHGIKVIYDAAHAFGISYNGKGVASFGDMSMFSFHATKVFNTIEGGAICCNDDDLYNKLRAMRNFGTSDSGSVGYISANAKMSEFQAAMGLCNLRHVDEEIAKRENAVKKYEEKLSNIIGIRLNCRQNGVKPNYAYYPVLFEEEKFGTSRDDVCNELAKNHIFARKYFYPLTSEFPCYGDMFEKQETPVAKKISEQVLTLPLYADLKETEVEEICGVITGLIKS